MRRNLIVVKFRQAQDDPSEGRMRPTTYQFIFTEFFIRHKPPSFCQYTDKLYDIMNKLSISILRMSRKKCFVLIQELFLKVYDGLMKSTEIHSGNKNTL